MVLSQKEKEAAKMGLPVFTVSLFFYNEHHSWNADSVRCQF